jgi:hypothetical protein
VAESGNVPNGEDLLARWAELMQRMATAGGGAAPRPPEHASSGPGPHVDGNPPVPAIDPRAMAFLGQATMAMMVAGARYWARAAEAWAKFLPLIAQGFAAPEGATAQDSTSRGEWLDQLRAALREFPVPPGQEAERLRAELDDIARRLWSSADEGRDGGHWRRWTVKP